MYTSPRSSLVPGAPAHPQVLLVASESQTGCPLTLGSSLASIPSLSSFLLFPAHLEEARALASQLHSDPGAHPTAFIHAILVHFMDMVAQRSTQFLLASPGDKRKRSTCTPLALTLSPGPLTPCSRLQTLSSGAPETAVFTPLPTPFLHRSPGSARVGS